MIATKNSVRLREFLTGKKSDKLYNEIELKKLFLEEDFKSLSFAALHDLRTGMYLAAFRAGDLGYNGTSPMSDDAGQFNYIYSDHGLCWIHELRHYKFIEAFYGEKKVKLNIFLTSAWNLFRLIKSVRENLNNERAALVLEGFEKVFGGAKTDFKELDKQRALSYLKIEKLLAPLWNKTLPLHNNEAELDVRGKVIKRKISLSNNSFKGANPWDIYLGFSKSCKKLKVNFYQKVLKTFNKEANPSLANLVYST